MNFEELDPITELRMEDFAWLLHAGRRYGRVWYQSHSADGPQWQSVEQFADFILPTSWEGEEPRSIIPNQFFLRYESKLRSLTCCFVDIAHVSDVAVAMNALDRAKIPRPSIVVSSGRSFQFYWLLNRAPAVALPGWNRIQARIHKQLQNLSPPIEVKGTQVFPGATRPVLECVANLPLVGAKDEDNGLVRGFLLDDRRYSLRELEKILGLPRTERKKEPEEKIFFPDPPIRRDPSLDLEPEKGGPMRPLIGDRLLPSYRVYWRGVESDLRQLAFELVPEHMRDVLLRAWITCQAWLIRPNDLWPAAVEFTRLHMKKYENQIGNSLNTIIRRARESARGEKRVRNGKEKDPRYSPSAARLYKDLNYLIRQSPHRTLTTIVSPEVQAERQRARRDRQDERRKIIRQDRCERGRYLERERAHFPDLESGVVALREQGLNQREIAKRLKCSAATVSRALKRANAKVGGV